MTKQTQMSLLPAPGYDEWRAGHFENALAAYERGKARMEQAEKHFLVYQDAMAGMGLKPMTWDQIVCWTSDLNILHDAAYNDIGADTEENRERYCAEFAIDIDEFYLTEFGMLSPDALRPVSPPEAK